MHFRHREIVVAARACVGTRTRVQGRAPGLALDCIGVAAAAARGGGLRLRLPADYCLAADNRVRLSAGLRAAGCREVADAAPGDIAVLAVAPGQHHLAVCCGDGFVHAHFGVGRVVEAPLPADWSIVSCWRLPESD